MNELIFEKIKYRYDFYDMNRIYDRMRQNKLLLDTFYPMILSQEIINPRNGVLVPERASASTGYAISERVAVDIGSRRLHISELVSMLGYTKTDISKLVQAVKNKELYIALVGVGGTGSNFLHWMQEMTEWVGKDRIFSQIHVYDDDDFDIPNMLRIPFIPEFRSESQSAKKVDCLPGKFRTMANIFKVHPERLTETHLESNSFGIPKRSLVYGAPDIATRSWLSASGHTFIAATHRDSEFSLVENPAVDDELMMETYGKINLSAFLLNHLTMTIKFLEHLRDRTAVFGTTEEAQILRADFSALYADQLENGFKAGSKKLFVHNNGSTVDLNVEGAA